MELMWPQRWLWGPLDVGLWWGGVSVQSYAQILPSGVKEVHLSCRQCPAAPIGGAVRGGGVRALSRLPNAHHPLPTAPRYPSQTCSGPVLH